jgi:hypothetical protein
VLLHTSTSYPALHGSRGKLVDEVVLRGLAVALDVWNGGADLGELGAQGEHQVAVLDFAAGRD